MRMFVDKIASLPIVREKEKIMSSDNALTRAEIQAAIYKELGLSLAESADLVDATIEEMMAGLAKDQQLKLSGFGTFEIRRKEARTGRNPKTGVEAEIEARNVILFNASNQLKDEVNGAAKSEQKKKTLEAAN